MPGGPMTRRVMAGTDIWTLPVRSVLRVCSATYGLAVAVRNRRYDGGMHSLSVEVPVISVGNITTGGTGKTPLVTDIVDRLQQRGHRVAVLSRGYRAEAGGMADEVRLMSRKLPQAVFLQDPNRCGAARRAMGDHQVNAIVLDDAFQHRRIARDLDMVTIDATCPFGYGHLLPRGLLREPLTSLGRAHLIVITRADQAEAEALRTLHGRLEQVAPGVRRIACRHRPSGFVRLDGTPDEFQPHHGCKIVCVSAIGNPAAFEKTVRQFDAEVVRHLVYPDHHRYAPADLRRIAAVAARHDAAAVVTTEKDAVKLAALSFDWPCRMLALCVQIDFLDGGNTILDRMLGEVMNDRGATGAQGN